ncbi:MAG: hypothetical protein A2010_01190 [Nitrospirae bacterium GWD2_57_9]|nr:MAG: hypothetical protein A2010_01190 [Nitrospirae bacterium GWD2_57_9]
MHLRTYAKPYRKNNSEKVFINAGSVGKPTDGAPGGMLEITDEGPYDVERMAPAVIAGGLPSGWLRI